MNLCGCDFAMHFSVWGRSDIKSRQTVNAKLYPSAGQRAPTTFEPGEETPLQPIVKILAAAGGSLAQRLAKKKCFTEEPVARGGEQFWPNFMITPLVGGLKGLTQPAGNVGIASST